MKQNRQSKIVTILALCVSILGLTLGFAAFSNTLTISSSATVTPKSSDFKFEIHGISQNLNNYESIVDIIKDKNVYDSLVTTSPKLNGGATSATPVINNENLTISNLKAHFTNTHQSVNYYFMVKNIGEYDAYISHRTVVDLISKRFKGTCTAGEGTTESLVQAACEKIFLNITMQNSNDATLYTEHWLKKGDVMFVYVVISYPTSPMADGPFTVDFDDINLNFSTSEQ